MDSSDVTFVFEGDRAFALQGGQVIASANTIEELESAMDDRQKVAAKQVEKTATHVIHTPSGIEGQILGRVKDLWGETVTVRLANNHIVELPVNQELTFHRPTSTIENPVEDLQSRVAQDTLGSFAERTVHLESILSEAHHLVGQRLSDTDLKLAHTIVSDVQDELKDLLDRQAYLDAEHEDGVIPTAPFAPTAIEQASLGGKNDSAWLDDVHGQMVDEAQNTDYDALLNEVPESFAAGLETTSLADAGVVHQMASSYVAEKIVLADPAARQRFASAFLERVERCRREELRTRQVSTQKEAKQAIEDVSGIPDDALFS